jgi:molybdopterin biosynthesis enzyme MoaB
MRYRSMQVTPKGMLSRGVAGIRKNSIIINLPGSAKAVHENLEVVLPVLKHAVGTLRGTDVECGGQA